MIFDWKNPDILCLYFVINFRIYICESRFHGRQASCFFYIQIVKGHFMSYDCATILTKKWFHFSLMFDGTWLLVERQGQLWRWPNKLVTIWVLCNQDHSICDSFYVFSLVFPLEKEDYTKKMPKAWPLWYVGVVLPYNYTLTHKICEAP